MFMATAWSSMTASTENAQAGFDSDFAEELEQLEYYSHGDYVEVEVTSVNRPDDNTATVVFTPPLGGEFEREMDVPVDPSTETEFTRLLEEAGRNFSTASEIVGDRVPAKYTDDGWVIQYTEPKFSVRERVSKTYTEGVTKDDLLVGGLTAAALGAFIYWPVTGIFVSLAFWLHDIDDDDTEDMPFMGAVFTYGIGLLLWGFVSMVVRIVAGLLGFQFPVEVTLLL